MTMAEQVTRELRGVGIGLGVAQGPVARMAEALYRDGEFAQAAAAFLAAADEQRSRRDFYHLRAAESWRELADLDAAERALEGIGRRRLDEEESLRLDLLLAELALRRQEMQAAQQLLVRPSDTVPERFRARYHDLAARAWAPDDPFLAASEHALLHDYLRPAEQPGNLQRIEALLVRVPNAELATRTAALPPGHPLYRHAGHALSVRGMPLPRIDDRSIGWQQDGSAPAADVDGYRPPRRVALLLPAQGPMAAAGRAVREGFTAQELADAKSGLMQQRLQTRTNDAALASALERAEGLVFPLIVPALGALTAIAGVYLTRPRHGESGLTAINRSFYVSAVISIVLCTIAAFTYLPSSFTELLFWRVHPRYAENATHQHLSRRIEIEKVPSVRARSASAVHSAPRIVRSSEPA